MSQYAGTPSSHQASLDAISALSASASASASGEPGSAPLRSTSSSKHRPAATSRAAYRSPSAAAAVKTPPPPRSAAGKDARSVSAIVRAASATIFAVSSYPGSPPEIAHTPRVPFAACATHNAVKLEAWRRSLEGPSPGFGNRPASRSCLSFSGGIAAFFAILAAAAAPVGASCSSRYRSFVGSMLAYALSSQADRRTTRELIRAIPNGATHLLNVASYRGSVGS
mmetsp:Transcript_31992/g.97631  ORF Transcript_31992/g.97631 Transcript_31992/m.97631 type:complete len:225 (-) Transcript_31992:815-1489(-)